MTENKSYVITNKSIAHEDWKTALVRPHEYPQIPPKTKCEFVGKFFNFYGDFFQIRGPNGNIYYVKPEDVDFVK